VVAGVGNIYADEALFRSGIHPRRLVGLLTPNEVACLHHAVRTVLTEATSGGGTTSDEYVDADGQAGRYTPLVYDRAGQRCRACGDRLARIKVVGRGTTFCPSCQA
jgi:formamidopyrimidine-DNA glycosylase